MSRTVYILASFIHHIVSFAHEHKLRNLVGIELLNEPNPGSSNDALKKWYIHAIDAVRKANPEFPIYISDSWMTDQYADFIKSSEYRFVVLDHHLYRCFTHDDINTTASEHTRRLRDPNDSTPSTFARVSEQLKKSGVALVVGEWSAALNPGSLRGARDERQEKRVYVEAQLQLFDKHCAGWFFWTYKKESKDTGWSFRDAVEAGVFPCDFRRIKGVPAPKDPERDARKQAAKENALGMSFGPRHLLCGGLTRMDSATCGLLVAVPRRVRALAVRGRVLDRLGRCVLVRVQVGEDGKSVCGGSRVQGPVDASPEGGAFE